MVSSEFALLGSEETLTGGQQLHWRSDGFWQSSTEGGKREGSSVLLSVKMFLEQPICGCRLRVLQAVASEVAG